MMLEPSPIFKTYQFVQKIEFKNKDIHRSDLGLDYFGFIKTAHVIERTLIEYEVVFAFGTKDNVLEYSLRPLTGAEIQSRLEQILSLPNKYRTFIEALNSEPNLQIHYHSLVSNPSLSHQLIFK